MAEMSFAPRMRAARGPPTKQEMNEQGLLGVLGLNDTFKFMQGCVASRPIASDSDALLVVDFPERPAKMLAVALPDYGNPALLKTQLCDLPRLPMGKLKPTEVVVEVFASSVNPTDCKQRKGTLSTICPLSLPCILGIDFSGRIVRNGEDSPFNVGDEVFGRQTLDRMRELNGTYAEYCIVDCSDIALKPTNLSHDQAAAVPHACLAAYSSLAHVGNLLEKKRQSDKAVLVLGGSGGVGSFAVQLAKRHFNCYTVASCSKRNMDFVKSLGADEAWDYTDAFFLKSAGLTKFDVILDTVGGDDYWSAFRGSLSHNGVYVTLVGNARHLADEKSVDWGSMLEIRADYLFRQISNKLGAAENYHILTGSQIRSSDLKIISSLLEEGTLRVIVDKTFSIYDIIKAHEYSETHHAVGKIVLQIKQSGADKAGGEQVNGVVMDERWQLPISKSKKKPEASGSNSIGKGVTFDKFNPPGLDSPAQPDKGNQPDFLFSSPTHVGNSAPPPSLHQDDEVAPPAHAVLGGLGLRPGELAAKRSPSVLDARPMGRLGKQTEDIVRGERDRSLLLNGGKEEAYNLSDIFAQKSNSISKGLPLPKGRVEEKEEDADVEDLTARLDALHREVAESAARVQQLKSPASLNQISSSPSPSSSFNASEPSLVRRRIEELSKGERNNSVKIGSVEVKEYDPVASLPRPSDYGQQQQQSWGAHDNEEEEEEEEKPGGSTPQDARGQADMESVIANRRELQAAAEEGGVALGTGNIFNRPSPAELLNSHKRNSTPQERRGADHRGSTPSAHDLISYEGILRKKKDDHKRFEDPYKQAFSATLKDGVLSIRPLQAASLAGEDESYDLRTWRLLPRSDKLDRFSLTRGISSSSADQSSGVSFKAESKNDCGLWVDAIKSNIAALRKAPQANGSSPAPPPLHNGQETGDLKSSSPPDDSPLVGRAERAAKKRAEYLASHTPEKSADGDGGQRVNEVTPQALPPLRTDVMPAEIVISNRSGEQQNKSMAPESASMAQLMSRQTEVNGRGAGGREEENTSVKEPSSKAFQPESSSYTELQARQGAVPTRAQPIQPPSSSSPAGVGIIFKESRRNSATALVVKGLAAGGPAERSGMIQVGDILLKVDGQDVNSTEIASQLILGQVR